jgi:hypothetical protein
MNGKLVAALFLVLVTILGYQANPTVSAQAGRTFITIYGHLAFSQCTTTSTVPSLVGPCQSFFYLITNGSTPGIPSYLTLDFSQSTALMPSQSDVGKTLTVIGYYGLISPCPVGEACPVFFVHTWQTYFPTSIPTTTGCFVSTQGGTWQSTQCVTAPTLPLVGTLNTNNYPVNLSSSQIVILIGLVVLVAYLFTHRKN